MILLLALLLAQTGSIPIAKPGSSAQAAVPVQGVTNGIPIPISGTVNSAGAADTVGANATFNANSICATVLLAGQPGAGFFLAAGTLAATLTPSVSEDATPASPGCTGGNWTASKFVTDVSGNTSATLVVTNPNAFSQYGVATLAGSRCARVCTTSFTSGSAVGNLTGTVALSPSPAPSADVTDRTGRLLGKVTGSDGSILSTANTGRLQVDVVTGGGSNGSVGTDGAAPPGSETLGGGSVTTAAPTYTTGQMKALSLTTAGGLRVDGSGVTQPVSGTVTTTPPANASTNVAQFGGTNVSTGTGAGGAGIPRVTISSDSSLAANQSVNVAQIGGAATTTLAAGEQKNGVEGLAASGAAKSGNPVQVGGVFNTTQPTVTTGQAVEAQATARGELLIAKGVSGFTIDNTGFTVTNTPTVVQGNAGSNAQAWWFQLGDTATGPVAVKAASTAVAAADKSLAVGLSPNSPLPTGSNTIGAVTAPGAAALALDASVTGLEVAQGSTTSGQKGVLSEGAVTTAAPTYTTAQTSPLSLQTDGSLRVAVTAGGGSNASVVTDGAAPPASDTMVAGSVTTSAPTYTTGQSKPLSLDTSGNLRVLSTASGTTTVQGLGTAGAPSGGVQSVQIPAGAPTITVTNSTGVADVQGTQINLNAACSTGVSCAAGSTAIVSVAGGQSIGLVFSSATSPLMTVVTDCSLDGGSTYQLTSTPSTTGVVIMVSGTASTSTLSNPGNGMYGLAFPAQCNGMTTVRVRASAYTSGGVNALLRTTFAPTFSAPIGVGVFAGQQALQPYAAAAALPANVAKTVCFRNLPTSSDFVWYGNSASVNSTTGQPYAPGEGDCKTVSNSNLIYFATQAGATVAFDGSN